MKNADPRLHFLLYFKLKIQTDDFFERIIKIYLPKFNFNI